VQVIVRTIASLVALVLCCNLATAQDSAFVRALKANATELSIVEGRLRGPGADLLAREAQANQFILVGEDHGIREVPEFVGALFETARPAGYSHIAVEVGPETSRMLETMMRAPTAQSDLDAFLARYTPFTIPFFFWREEAQMLEHVVRSEPGKRDVVWGLDQEFVMAPTYLFEKLATIATTERARASARKLAASSGAADKAMIATRNPGAAWMFSATDADVAELRAAFDANQPAEAKTIIDELTSSRDIYRTFNSGGNYEANQVRADLMKRHFVEHYRAAQARGERRPKVVIKLGANHVFRGPSITNSYEMGSFAPEFALAEGGRALNILLVVKRGTSNAFRPFGSKEADKTSPYDLLTSDEYAVFDMPSVVAASSDTTMTLIDLRPERSMVAGGSLKRLGPTGRRLVNSFDAIVVVPEGHASVYIRN
jgi:hypothetical protein